MMPVDMSEKKKVTGIAQAILAHLAFGWIVIFGKMAYREGIGTIELVSYRFGLSALVLWIYSLMFAKKSFVFRPSHLPVILAMGVLGYATVSLSYFYALNFISASLTTLILYVKPSITTLLARLFFGEPLTPRKILALFVTFSGACLIIGFEIGVVDSRGIFFALFAVFVSALYSTVGQSVLKTTPPKTVSLYVITAAGLFFSFFHNPLAAFHGSCSLEGLLLVLLLVFVSTIPPIFLFLAAIEKIGSARAAMLNCAEPLMAVVAAYIILGERLTPVQIVGGGAIIAGAFLVSRI